MIREQFHRPTHFHSSVNLLSYYFCVCVCVLATVGPWLHNFRLTRYSAFYNEFVGAWWNLHRGNALKFSIMGRVIIRRPVFTDAVLRSCACMTAQVCLKPNSTRRLRHYPPPIKSVPLAFVGKRCRNSFLRKKEWKKARVAGPELHVAEKHLPFFINEHGEIKLYWQL